LLRADLDVRVVAGSPRNVADHLQGEYEALEPGDKGLISAWILGYFNASRNLNIVQERYVDRNLEKLNEYCHHHKESGILADIEKIGH